MGVIIDPKPTRVGLPTEAYKVVEEIHDDGTPTSKTFEHVPSEIGAEEAEEVGVEHLLRDVKDTTVGTLSQRITGQLMGLKGLNQKLRDMKVYLEKVVAGELPMNHEITYQLQDIFNLLHVLVVVGVESSHNGHWLLRVQSVLGSRAVEVGFTHSSGGIVTAIFIANTFKTVGLGSHCTSIVPTLHTRTSCLFTDRTRVHGVCLADGVSLPHVELNTACAILSKAGVLIGFLGNPIDNIGHAIDPLQVMRALSITVACAVASTCLLMMEAVLATILVHGNKVQRTVQTARQFTGVNIESELTVLQLEHLVRVLVTVQQVHTRTDIGGIRTLRDKSQIQT